MKTLTPMVRLIKHNEATEKFERDLYYTDEPMYFHTHFNGDEIVVYVPRGFLTDGASVPKIFQKFFPVWDTYYQAAVFHDYLCEYLTVYISPQEMIPMQITRTEADMLFNTLMEEIGVDGIKRRLVNAGVVVHAHVKSIIYPSADRVKKDMEDKIRKDLEMRDLARENQKIS